MWSKLRAFLLACMACSMFIMSMHHIPHDDHSWWIVLDVAGFGFAVMGLAEAYNILIKKEID